jgi:hypothetical protein
MMPALPTARQRTANAGIAAAALAVACIPTGGVQAQMSEARCKVVMTIVVGVIHEYQGQISTDLISDLQRKVGEHGKCDGPDEYRVRPDTKDREALGRIRMLISAWDICQKEPNREGCQQ